MMELSGLLLEVLKVPKMSFEKRIFQLTCSLNYDPVTQDNRHTLFLYYDKVMFKFRPGGQHKHKTLIH